MLRLGKKYEFKHFRQIALQRLRAELPQTLEAWDKKYLGKSPLQGEETEFDLLNIALEVGVQTVLPIAFYWCLQHRTMVRPLMFTSYFLKVLIRPLGRNHPWYPPHRRHSLPNNPRIKKYPGSWEGKTLRRHCQVCCRMAQIRQVRPMPAMHVTRRLQSYEISHPRDVLADAKRVDCTRPRGPRSHYAQVLCTVCDCG